MPDSTRSTQLVIQNAQFQQDPQATLENDIESFVYPHETSTRSVSGKNVGVKFVIYPNDSFKIIDVQSNPTTTNHGIFLIGNSYLNLYLLNYFQIRQHSKQLTNRFRRLVNRKKLMQLSSQWL